MEIMFDDLTPEAQERLLFEAGISKPEDMHWDEVPVAVVEFREEDRKFEEVDFSRDVYGDYDYDKDTF
jgi:hypothetical protein